MIASDYHAHPALGSTQIRELLRSPAHFKALGEKEPTPAMQLGTLVHTLYLEPEEVSARYVVTPKVDRRTKAGKAAWADFQATAAGRELVDAELMGQANACAVALREFMCGKNVGSFDDVERSLFWEDADTGVACKARPDAITSRGIMIDVKTTRDASPGGFAKSIANFGYHVQAAHYLEAAAANGIHVDAFMFLAVETSAPHAAAAYLLDEDALAEGQVRRAEALDLYAACEASGEWPAYSGRIETISLPRWAFKGEAA